jgi:hypothetical protein
VAAGGLAAAVYLAFTCSSADVAEACPPNDSSRGASLLRQARDQVGFEILYPCELPNSQRLSTVSVIGDTGKQSVTLVFDGPFELSVRQSQVAPLVNADPAGASHSVVDNLFPGVDADLIEINDGSSKALYHLVWARGGMYYEVLAVGPPLQRRAVLDAARSLQ